MPLPKSLRPFLASIGALALTGAVLGQQSPPTGTSPTAPPSRDPAPAATPPMVAPPARTPVRPGRAPIAPAERVPGAVNVPTKTAAPAQDLDATPIFRFEPEELDLGELQPETPKSGKVKIYNISDKPITIAKAIPSCGCTTPEWPKEPIAPGSFGEMTITLKAGAKAGIPLTKHVNLQVDGHAPVRYTLHGHVPEYVKITPEILEAPGNGDRPPTPSVTFTSVDGTPFRITNFTPAIAMAEDAAKAAEKPGTEHVIRIDWQKWTDSGRVFRANATIEHPKVTSLAMAIRRPIDRGSQNPQTATGNTPPSLRPGQNAAAARTPPSGLVFAAQRGDVEDVKRRLAAGEDPNAFDPASMRTALHWAAKNNNVEVIDALVAGGADVRVVEKMGRPPISLAAESGSVAAIERLLKAKADPNARDEYGGSPVLWASGLGTPEAVKALLDAGADPNVQDSNGITPLMWAANVGDPRNVAVLASSKGLDLNAVDKVSGETALMRAARNGKLDAIKVLVDSGATVDTRSRDGWTALLFACQSGNLETVKALVGAKADLKATGPGGLNAADLAARRKDGEGQKVSEFLKGNNVQPSNPVATTPATSDSKPAASAAGTGTTAPTKGG